MLISNNYISLYTGNNQAIQITKILLKYIDCNSVIVDANAGMGGNSSNFCKNFKYVYCIDNSSEAIIYLEHNLSNFNNKYIINDNCLDIIKIIKYDAIFFDPPWGGSSYKYKNIINLYLDNININAIIESLYLYSNIKLVSLKAPFNFNINYFTKWTINVHTIFKNNLKDTLFKLIIFTR